MVSKQLLAFPEAIKGGENPAECVWCCVCAFYVFLVVKIRVVKLIIKMVRIPSSLLCVAKPSTQLPYLWAQSKNRTCLLNYIFLSFNWKRKQDKNCYQNLFGAEVEQFRSTKYKITDLILYEENDQRFWHWCLDNDIVIGSWIVEFTTGYKRRSVRGTQPYHAKSPDWKKKIAHTWLNKTQILFGASFL